MDELLKYQLEQVTRLSHDLKEPLNTVYGAFQILQMHDSGEDARKQYYDAAERNIRKMTRMINHFTEFYRVTQKEMKINPKMIDGRRLVESLCNAVRDCFWNGKPELIVDIQGEGLVCLDELLLEHAFLNLVSNGIKATKEEPCKLEITAFFEDGGMSLSVRDFGIGIAEEHHKIIFEPLIQLGEFKKGTGLGLSIVSEVVKLHQGELCLESEPGKGSTFTIKIPFQQPVESNSTDLEQFDPDMDRLQRTKIALAEVL